MKIETNQPLRRVRSSGLTSRYFLYLFFFLCAFVPWWSVSLSTVFANAVSRSPSIALIDDGWEVESGLDPADPDSDSLSNLTEYENGGFLHSNPHDPDTDSDGVRDDVECPTCSPLDRGRARLTPDPDFGPTFAFTLPADTIDSGSTVEIASPFFQLHDGAAFLIVLKSDAGHSFIYSTTASAGQILFDPYAADLNGNYLASGAYSVTIYQDFVGLIFSGSRTIDLRRFLYIHSGSQGPVLATSDDKHATVIWRRGSGLGRSQSRGRQTRWWSHAG